MKKTANLKLPIYDNPEVDVFDLEDWNIANQNLDNAFGALVEGDKLDIINSEVVDARKGKLTLKEKIDEIDTTTQEINSQLEHMEQQKATKEELNALGQLKLDGVYATLVDLQTAFPSGATGLYLITADGFTYRWGGSAWIKAVQFQSSGIADDSILPTKLKKDGGFETVNLLTLGTTEKIEGKRFTEYDTNTFFPLYGDLVSQDIYTFKIPSEAQNIEFNFNSTNIYNSIVIFLLDNEKKRVMHFSKNNVINNQCENYITFANDKAVIDIPLLKRTRPTTVYLSISFLKSDNNYASYEKSIVTSLSEFKWLKYEDEINEVVNKKNYYKNCAELILPRNIPIVSGRELNVYYENILYNKMLKNVFILPNQNELGGKFYEGVWQYTPNVSMLSYGTMTFKLYENNLTDYISKSVNIRNIPLNQSSGNYKVLIIGDSKIDGGIIPRELNNLFTNDEYTNVTFLGTRGSDVKHEGRSGWTAKNYCVNDSFNNKVNAFYNNSTFDFSYYMSTQGYDGVDCVCINLGTNDAVRTSDYASILSYYDIMINSIHQYNPNIKILIGLAENMSQERWVFGLNKNRILGLVKELINKYDTDYYLNKNISLIPLYVNQNLYLDYNYSNVAESSRNPTMVNRVSDETHQNNYGYYKNADMIYSAIKYYLS